MDSLAIIQEEAESCTKCHLGQPREGKLVFGSDLDGARWCFIGEAPGQAESEQGLPFVGRSGQLLNSMLEELGWSRNQVGVMNSVHCRPPDNRDPTTEEKQTCRPYFERKIKLIEPVVITALGRHAASSLLGSPITMGAVRGKTFELMGAVVIPTYHPSYVLRGAPGARETLREDLILAISILAEKGIGP